ncbi:hypothetical protein J437_LFUL013607 [Ladona fulva]|uniref:C2H2-type domain-containing protein n=1 Tax=Ladona fulva TaxID=123851 RepID=A0A8K0P4Q1_LADFU|nr:hypothetical protein J437_LFUL013607 [Ladona fulva]
MKEKLKEQWSPFPYPRTALAPSSTLVPYSAAPSSPKWGPPPPRPHGKQMRRRVVVALLPPDEEAEEAPAAPLGPLFPHHPSRALPSTSSSFPSPTSKSYACPRCDRRYSVSYTLERHLRYECGVAKQFACPVCLRRFSRRDVLRAHQRKAGHHQHHRHHLVPSPTSAASRAVEEAASALI